MGVLGAIGLAKPNGGEGVRESRVVFLNFIIIILDSTES